MLPLATALVTAGCAARANYRVYDPYHRDYHVWDDHERVYYDQWARESHREPHRGYRKLNHEEQKEYWNWRHSQPDRH